MRRNLMILVFLMVFQISAQEPITCDNALPSRLLPGMIAQTTPGPANRLRNEPGLAGEIVGLIPGETAFYVLNGPVCQGGFAWWYVAYANLVGWTVEAGDGYWLEPVSDVDTVPQLPLPNGDVVPFEFNGVVFDYDANLAPQLEVVIVPEQPRVEGGRNLAAAPEHTRIDFLIEDSLFDGFLHVYPAVTYEKFKDTSLDGLRSSLENRPEEPTLAGAPIVNAGMPFAVQVDYIEFEGGSGLRALVYWAQNAYILNGDSLQYVFAGLTDDGEHLIHFRYPIASDRFLPAQTNIGDNWDYRTFNEGYLDYIGVMEEVVDTLPASSFSPSIDVLDELIESLVLSEFYQAQADE